MEPAVVMPTMLWVGRRAPGRFAPLHRDVIVDGVPVWFVYAGAGGHRVVFRRQIAPGCAPPLPGSGSEHGGSSQEGLHQVLVS